MFAGICRKRIARSFPALLLILLGSVVVVPATPAYAVLAGFKTVQDSYGWVDFNGDGRTDHCQPYNDGLRCVLINGTGTGLGQLIVLTSTDKGYGRGRAWTDVNNDQRADYCRVVGGGSKSIQCTVSAGTAFGTTFTSGALDPGYDAGRAWADFNGDGRADYCRVVGSWDKRAQCTLSTGTGFGQTITSGAIDPGWDAGRAWVDVNGDRRADYCRVVNSAQLQCTVSSGGSFGQTFTSVTLDGGYDDSRKWADFNGDGRADFCRNVGSVWYAYTNVRCTMSTGANFGSEVTSPVTDAGYPGTVGWADVNGDGRDDHCRVTGGEIARCTLSTGTSFGATMNHPSDDVTIPGTHGWVDINGDGLADHGFFYPGTPVTITLSTGTGWASNIYIPMPL